MMTASREIQNRKAPYINPYAQQAKLYSLKKIKVKEPLKPYADFQQLKMTKVKEAKIKAKKAKPLKMLVNQKPMPFIQLQGQWLTKAGFSIGKHCLIKVYKGMLVITLDEPINPPEKISSEISKN